MSILVYGKITTEKSPCLAIAAIGCLYHSRY